MGWGKNHPLTKKEALIKLAVVFVLTGGDMVCVHRHLEKVCAESAGVHRHWSHRTCPQ
jgi:hypothetical protein